MDNKLKDALDHDLWKNHKIGDRYRMDGKGNWELVYYPIMGCGKTQKEYDEPRALMQTERLYNGVPGVDMREVPLRYIERIEFV